MRRVLAVRFSAAESSRVTMGRGALDHLGRHAAAAVRGRRAAVISDARVGRLYGPRAAASLRRAGFQVVRITVPAGEAAKSPRVLGRLWAALARAAVSRGDVVVALGGGSVGDAAGFAAATWLRGVRWVCVPTTLLAQADASVGGKTGVDLAAGKNLAGAFHQPAAVVTDPDTLATLPPRQRRAGLAEIAKVGMAADGTLFRWMERHAAALEAGDPAALEEAVWRAARAKLRIVRRDPLEREGGSRTALNYGHTLGHALESALGYRKLLHGEAVAIGMRASAALSQALAGLPPEARARQDRLLDALGLPRGMPPVPFARLWSAMRRDKKGANGKVRWVLTPRVGHASVPRPIAPRLVRAVVARLGARA